MLEIVTKPVEPVLRRDARPKMRPIAEIPAPGEQNKEQYVLLVKSDAPFEWCHIAGFGFTKSCEDPEKSVVGNEGKRFPYKIVPVLLTQKQAAYIVERSKLHNITIPRKRDGEEIKRAYKVNAADWIIIQKVSEFSLSCFAPPHPEQNQPQPQPVEDGKEEMRQELLKKQSSLGKKQKEK